jgi:hypothetical protein
LTVKNQKNQLQKEDQLWKVTTQLKFFFMRNKYKSKLYECAIMLFQTASEKKAVDVHAQSTQEFRDNQHLSHSKQMGIPVNQPPKAFPCQKFVNKDQRCH